PRHPLGLRPLRERPPGRGARRGDGSRLGPRGTPQDRLDRGRPRPAHPAGRPAARADLLRALLLDDQPARLAHDHRLRHHRGGGVAGVQGPVLVEVLHADRGDGALLALRRYRVDLPVSAVLPDPTLRGVGRPWPTRTITNTTITRPTR